jgi:hypothetical protein
MVAKDVGVGPDGTTWAIRAADDRIFRQNGSTWQDMDGHSLRIDVGPNGGAYVVNAANTVWYSDGTPGNWTQLGSALANDISVGADGTVWITYTDRGIGRWNASTSTWERTDGSAQQVSVSWDGVPWVVNRSTQIWRGGPYVTPGNAVDFHTDWSDQSHIAGDIGVGHENTRWISEGGRVYRANGPGSWEDMGLDGARNLDVDPQGMAWVAMEDRSIKVWNGSGWQDIQTGGALDIGVGADGSGSVWIIGANPIGSVWLYNPSVDGHWINAQLQGATRVDVGTNGQPYVVKSDGTIWHYIGTRDGSHIEWVEVVRSLRAKDIGVGGPSLWAVGQDNSVHRWSAETNDWQRTNGQAYEISVDQYGNAWVVEAGTRNVMLGIGQ